LERLGSTEFLNGRKTPTPEFLDMPLNSKWSQTPIPDFLERPEIFCIIANANSRISGTTKYLYGRKPQDTDSGFSGNATEFGMVANIDSRISGTTIEFLYDRKHQLQNFWKLYRISV
jgi:hypothetical protein